MTDDLAVGHQRIQDAVTAVKASSSKPIIFVEHLRNFGDAMHSTIVIGHYRRTMPAAYVMFGVSERYANEFVTSVGLPDGPHSIVGLPHGPAFPYDGPLRVAWTKQAATLAGVAKVVTPSVHPYGWASGKRNLADAIFHNAGIKTLLVPRRPYLPVDITDYIWADNFQRQNNLLGLFVTMEFISYSIKAHDIGWYAELVKQIKCPVVAISGASDPSVPGAVNCKTATYRQAKVLTMRSKCFVGCSSGNSLAAVSDGCDTPLIEVIENAISFKTLKYVASGRKYMNTGFARTPTEIAQYVNAWL